MSEFWAIVILCFVEAEAIKVNRNVDSIKCNRLTASNFLLMKWICSCYGKNISTIESFSQDPMTAKSPIITLSPIIFSVDFLQDYPFIIIEESPKRSLPGIYDRSYSIYFRSRDIIKLFYRRSHWANSSFQNYYEYWFIAHPPKLHAFSLEDNRGRLNSSSHSIPSFLDAIKDQYVNLLPSLLSVIHIADFRQFKYS